MIADTYASGQYAMLVNRNTTDRVDVPLSVSRENRTISQISETNGSAKPLVLQDQRVTIPLRPGSGVLLRLDGQSGLLPGLTIPGKL